MAATKSKFFVGQAVAMAGHIGIVLSARSFPTPIGGYHGGEPWWEYEVITMLFDGSTQISKEADHTLKKVTPSYVKKINKIAHCKPLASARP